MALRNYRPAGYPQLQSDTAVRTYVVDEFNKIKDALQALTVNTPKVGLCYNLTGSAIRSSFGVASVAKNATGKFTITFETPFSHTNYIISFGGTGTAGVWIVKEVPGSRTTSTVQIEVYTLVPALADAAYVSVAIWG